MKEKILKIPIELLNKDIQIGKGCKAQEFDMCYNVYEIKIQELVDVLDEEIKNYKKLKSDLRKRNFKISAEQLKEYGNIIDLHYSELTNEVDL